MNYVVQNLLSKLLRKYLKNFNIELLILKGEASLKNLEIDEKSINHNLKENNLQFSMLHGEIKDINIKIPWKNLSHDNVKIDIQGITMKVIFIHKT